MKFKLFLLTTLLITFSINVFARSVVDSVGVENHKGKRVVIFKIKKKDTYYAIARHYHIDPKELQSYNDNAKMSIGHTIKVPTGKPYVEPKHHEKESAKNDKKKKDKDKKKKSHQDEEPVAEEPQQSEPVVQQQAPPQPQSQPVESTPPVQYKVSPHETLYSIAKRFNTTVDNIMKLNNLSSNTISPGQILLVGSNTPSTPAVIPAQEKHADAIIAKRDSTTMVSPQDSSNSSAYHMNANKYGLFEKDEKGVATWIEDEGLDPNKKLVLHRTAPIGTVIKITNVMTNRTTFAKVVGRFTDNEQTKDVVIVMTKNVAEALGALDKRFQVNISYGVPNEQ